MTPLILYVTLATLSPMLAAIIPIILQNQKKENSNYQNISLLLMGISAGMLFAVATLDLIPESIQFALSSPVNNYYQFEDDEHEHEHEHEAEMNVKFASLGVFFGFTLLFVIQQILAMSGGGHSHSNSSDISKRHNETTNNNEESPDHHHHFLHTQNFAALVGLSLHSFIDGVMISGAFSASESVGARVGIAIVLHKFPDGFVLSSLLQSTKLKHHRRNRSLKLTWFFVVCSMTVIGAIISSLIIGELPTKMLGFILGVGAGSFLFITCVIILPELMESKNKALSVVSFVVGYISFFMTDLFFDAH